MMFLAPMLGSMLSAQILAQTQVTTAVITATPLVTRAINETKLVTMKGSVHPLTQTGIDRGIVSDSFFAGQMILLLKRPPERAAALQQFLQAAHTHGLASYHQWLTPEQFGSRFGPADADIQTATDWLNSHGFIVTKASKSGQFIEFSGTAGHLREAFHTEIHQYEIHGETRYANASEIEIPEALAPLVGGVSPLNSFRAKSDLRIVGPARYSRSTGKTVPQWTLPNGGNYFYAVAPEDFATQYDLGPLYKAGVNGAGQTIGIINESNVDLSLVLAYQKLFGLSSLPPEVIEDGADPGTVSGVDIEAYLDIEEAGAVAPGAIVDLYISDAGSLTDPLYTAALRAVEDNHAGVLSVSFQNCEGFMSQAGNALWSGLWEQAAAQGQTVLVASGDSGSAGCDDANDQWITSYGLAVNGLASTPWDVAVGGTDFYYSDYASGGASAAKLWNQTNDAYNSSLKAPLPEQVWDTVYGLNATGPYVQLNTVAIPAGGGGASGCVNSAASAQGSAQPFVCSSVSGSLFGYAKPGWQSAPGVPADGVRDIPDVSLFAANGENFSAYPICAESGDCVSDASGDEAITIVGGTSASTPAMAGIMALVNQKYGRQGQANFTLYPLARQFPEAFHDVTLGSNNMTCLQGTSDCSLDKTADAFYSLQKYSAGTGYDLASGLGSVDANVLVNDWNSITFKPTVTNLQISPTSAQHGQLISFTVNVNPASGGGTPQGTVTILNNSPAPLSAGQNVQTIASNGAASGSLSNLPGGSYQVWAQYSGDGSYESSYSDPQMVTITPASGSLTLGGFGIGSSDGFINPADACQAVLFPDEALLFLGTLGGSFGPYPNGYIFDANEPVAAAAVANGGFTNLVDGFSLPHGSGTGTVTFSLDGRPISTTSLNTASYATWAAPSMFGAGSHSISATYSGDASYGAAMAAPFTFSVAQARTFLSVSSGGNCASPTGSPVVCAVTAGYSLPVMVQLEADSCQYPTGTVTISLGSLTQNVTLSPGGMGRGEQAILKGEAIFENLPAGSYALSATYAGDVNSVAATVSGGTVVATVPAGLLLPATVTVSANPSSLNYATGGATYFTATVTGGSGSTVPPTGSVMIFNDGAAFTGLGLTASGPNGATGITIGPAYAEYFDYGQNQVIGIYSGDGVYQSSVSAPITFDYVVPGMPDFMLAPQLTQVTVPSGSSATVGFNLNSLYSFNASVALSCSSSTTQVTCSLNPSTVTVNGQATTTLTINAAATTAQAASKQQVPTRWPIMAGMLSFGLLFLGRRARCKLQRTLLLGLGLFAALTATGCNSIYENAQGSTSPLTPPPTLVTYNVVVTGVTNGIVHNAKITVVIP